MAGKTVPPVTAASGGTGTTINFKNNCLICLQPEEPTRMLELLQKNPKNLRTFQPVLYYLTGTDPTYGRSLEDYLKKELPVFKNVPTLCQKCYNITADIYCLHAELLEHQLLIQKKVEEVRTVVKETRRPRGGANKSNRNQFITRLEESGMPKEQVKYMGKFVDNLHEYIQREGGKKVIFPSHPPPNFLPLPKKPQATQIVLVQIPRQPVQQQPPSTSTTTPTPITASAAVTTSSAIKTKGVNSASNSRSRKPPPSTRSSPSKRKLMPTIISTSSLAVTNSTEPINAPPPPPAIANSKSDMVIIPGSSSIVKFENENDAEEEEDNFEENTEEPCFSPEVTMKEEPVDEIIVPDDDDAPVCGVEDSSGDSDKEWSMDDEKGNGSDESDSADEGEGPSRNKIPRRTRKQQSKSEPNSTTPKGLFVSIAPKPPVVMVDRETVSPPRISSDSDSNGARRRKQVLETKDQLPQKSRVVKAPAPATYPPKAATTRTTDKSDKVQFLEDAKCDICYSKYPVHQLKSHVRVHLRGKDGHFCVSCRSTFISRSRLLQHWKQSPCGTVTIDNKKPLDDPLICTCCSLARQPDNMTLSQFRDHVFTCHENDSTVAKVYRCIICPEKFHTDLGLDLHLNVHVHKRQRFPHHLDICPPPGPLPSSADTNSRWQFKLRCDLCQFRFQNLDYLENHFTSKHNLSPQDLITCQLCPFVSSKLETHLEHLTSQHATHKEKPCHVCHLKFEKAYQVRVHLYQEHGLGEVVHCEFCDKRFLEKKGLASHVQQYHNDGEENSGGLSTSGTNQQATSPLVS